MKPFVPKRLYGVVGHPLGHSLSPLLHNWGFQATGHQGAYLAFPTPPERLGDFMTAVRALPLSGVSVTIPHKEAVMACVDEITDQARAIGAVNTLYWRDDRLIGENTDITGFLAPLAELAAPPSSALLLGAGGAAAAAAAGLVAQGVRLIVTNRNAARGLALAERFGGSFVPWEERIAVDADLLVNCTPLGLAGGRENDTPWPAEAFRAGMIAYDMVYNPLMTRFLIEAEAADCHVLSGLDMFLAQAQAQFELWTGQRFDEKEALALLRAKLE